MEVTRKLFYWAKEEKEDMIRSFGESSDVPLCHLNGQD